MYIFLNIYGIEMCIPYHSLYMLQSNPPPGVYRGGGERAIISVY